jgi:hypothetical protein
MEEAYKDYSNPILWSPKTIDESTSFLHRSMEAALDEVAPITPYQTKKAIFSWFTEDLRDLQRTCRSAHEFARRQPHLEERWTNTEKLKKTISVSALKFDQLAGKNSPQTLCHRIRRHA